jgi:hypothetical protein
MAESTLQSDFIIGVLTGSIALTALSLAVFEYAFGIFYEIMSKVGLEKPPKSAYNIKNVAYWICTLTSLSSFIVTLCIIWIFVPGYLLFVFISMSLILLLICTCLLVFFVIKTMMPLQ